MNSDNSPLKNGKNIQQVYKYIKTDNLNGFLNLLDKYPAFIFFKNNLKENLLFYSLQCGSQKIASYIIKEQENFLYEKNRYALTPLSNLIYTNNSLGLLTYQELVENNIISLEQLEKNYYIGGERYNLAILAVLKLNHHNWYTFSELTEQFWNNSDLTIKYDNELTIPHLIAKNNLGHCLNLIPYLPKELFHDNNFTYGTPLLTAATYSSKDIFNAMLPFSNIYEKASLGNNIIHLGTNNHNLNIVELTKNFDFDYTQKNSFQLSPLYKAIMSKNEKCIFELLPYYRDYNLNDEIYHFTQNFPKKSELVEKLFNNINYEQLEYNTNNKKEIISIFSYIFYYYNEKQMKDFASSKNAILLDIFKNEHFMRHQLYVSSIMGRKAMSFKINLLQNIGEFLSINDSDKYYNSHIKKHKIEFSNSENISNLRFNNHFCFMSALGSLPFTQIKEINAHTNILNNLNESDYILFRSILLKKNLSYHLLNINKYIKKDFHIIPESNLDLAIQQNIHSFFENFNNEKLRDEVSLLINYFQDSPKFLINATIDKTINFNDTNIINYAYRTIDNNVTKKELIINFMEKLISTDYNEENLENFLIDNKTLNTYFFNHLEKNGINNIVNRQYFNKLLKHKLEFTNLNFLFSIMQSDNPLINQLVKDTLLYIDPNKYDYNIVNIEQKVNSSINNYTWGIVLNHFYGTKYFNPLLSLYLNNEVSYLNNINLDTFDIAINYYNDSIEPILNKISLNTLENTQLTYNDFKEKLIHIVNKLNEDKEPFYYIHLVNEALMKNNFFLVNILIEHYNIDVETLNIENSLNSKVMQQKFHFDLTGNIYQPFKEYLNFINLHKDNFSPAYWEKVTTDFYNWLVKHPNDSFTKTDIASLYFSNIQEYILEIPDQIIINICSNILEQTSDNSHIAYLKNTKNDNLEKMLDILFEHQDHEFIMNLQNDHLIKENVTLIPLNQQAILRYHFLEDKLKNKDIKKKNKI